MSTAIEIFFRRAGAYAARNPAAAVGADATLGEIAGVMSSESLSAVVVTGPDDRPVGIVTERDIVRRAAFRAAPDQPVGDVMTAPVRCIGDDEPLFTAIARMRRFGHRHMPVTDGEGRFSGLLDLHLVTAVAAGDTMDRIDALTRDDSLDGLREIKAVQAGLAGRLLADNVPAPEIQRLLTHVNNDIYVRLFERNGRAMEAEGRARPDIACCLIIMGSGGRGENFLTPDQDYGFILDDCPADHLAAADTWFAELAERLSRDLDHVGLPYCRGDVMATNPRWRRTITGWKAQVDEWNRRARAVPLLDFDIFFDFRPASGATALATELRRHVTSVTRGNDPFLRALYAEDRDHGSALRSFGRFVTERGEPAHRGKTDVKLYGLLPLVEGIRMLSLRGGIEATGTLERLAALRDAAVVDADDFADLEQAYLAIAGILLRQQVADFAAGAGASNFVDAARLSRFDRGRLRRAFRAIDGLRARINFEFGGEIF